jgi:ferredoxin
VKIVAGEEALTPLNAAERKHLGNVYFITKQRLSCQARVCGDVVVQIPSEESPTQTPSQTSSDDAP